MKALWLCVLALCLTVAMPSVSCALDTDPWAAVLRAHVRDGRVDYTALRADKEARASLSKFLQGATRMKEDEPLATWLNGYNALVVSSLVERSPLRAVRGISGFFDGRRHRVAGKSRTLDELEREVIFERFKDSRVHAAICYGTRSSPPLQAEPFAHATLDVTLTRLSQELVNNEANVQLVEGRLWVSSMFYWFTDFTRDAGSVVGWIKKYGASRYADLADDVPMSELNHDWSLNKR
jgi:hypothetical protein